MQFELKVSYFIIQFDTIKINKYIRTKNKVSI